MLARHRRAIDAAVSLRERERVAEFGPRRRGFPLGFVAERERDERASARIELLALDELRARHGVATFGHELLRFAKERFGLGDRLRRGRLGRRRSGDRDERDERSGRHRSPLLFARRAAPHG